MPSITPTHDPKYHLWGLIGIRNGARSSGELRQYILRRNDAFAQRFRLVVRDSPMEKIGDLIALELEQMGYILRETSGYRLTSKGNNLSLALENKETAQVAVTNDFMPTMISTFDDMQIFLKEILRLGDAILIPKVPNVSEVYKNIQDFDLSSYLKRCKTYISSKWTWPFPLQWNEDVLSEKTEHWVKESTSTKPFDLARALYRDYFLNQYFKGELGDVKYKVIRDRFHYFGLANYSEHLPDFDGEVMYPLIWRERKTRYTRPIVLGQETYYYSHPSWQEISKEFLSALLEVHRDYPGVGYVPVMDLRDRVCFKLRISDHDFDNLLRQAYIEGQRGHTPIRILADPTNLGGRETSKKRMPIDFGEATGMGVRTLIALDVSAQKS
jgi:hypothetical protein